MSARPRVMFPYLLALAALTLAALASPVPAEVVEGVDLGGLETRSAALILSAQEGGALRPELAAAPLPGLGGRARVALVVEVPGAALLTAHEEDDVLLELYVYALGENGTLGGFLTQGTRLPLERHRAMLERRGAKLLAELELAPGRYSLRTLVFQRRHERFGLRSAALEVPAAEDLPRPLLLEPAEGWVLVRAAAPEGAPPPLFPLVARERLWVPAAGPGDGARLWVAGRELPPSLPARLFDLEGRPRARLELAGLDAVTPSAGGGLELAPAAFDSAGLGAGEYLLDLAGAGDAGAPSTAAVRLRIEPAADPAAAETAPASAAGRSAGALEAAYLEALRPLAGGDREAARAAVLRLEAATLAGGDSRRQAVLEEAVVAAASRLTALRAEAAVPLLELHERLYRDYRQERELFLATHSQRLVGRLAALYRERAASPMVPEVLAAVAVSRGARLLDEGAVQAALAAFDEALAHHPRDAGALAGAATIREALGDYEASAAALRRLLESDSAAGDGLAGEPLAEMRLRLGLSLRRLEAPVRAASLLRSCLDGGAPVWVETVARQELAALELDRGRAEAAVGLLEEGLAARPGDRQLSLQLAATLDRLGRAGAAAEVLRRISPPDPGVPSPRLRYASWPDWIAGIARRRLEAAADERREAFRIAYERLQVAD